MSNATVPASKMFVYYPYLIFLDPIQSPLTRTLNERARASPCTYCSHGFFRAINIPPVRLSATRAVK